MPLLRWFWGLKLRWRVPLGVLALLAAAAGLYVLVSYVRYRSCRSLDLLALVPGPDRLPVVVRCRGGGAHWDRIQRTAPCAILREQIERHGPLIEWIEAATGRSWNDLAGRLTSGPAAKLPEARRRGLFGADVVAALDPPPAAGVMPRMILLTRIGFLEYLAYPVVRRIAPGGVRLPMEEERYRRVSIYHVRGVPSAGQTVSFALKGDILIVSNEPDLLSEVIDRTFPDRPSDEEVPPWALPADAPLAVGVDMERFRPQTPFARSVRDSIRMFPIHEALFALDPDALGRCALGFDLRDAQVRVEGEIGLRKGSVPIAPAPPPAGSARTMLSAVPDHAIAFLVHQGPFDAFWRFFEKTTLDPARELVGRQAITGLWRGLQREARNVEIPALRQSGLDASVLPRLRSGPAVVVTRESGPPPKTGEPPLQTLTLLMGTGAEPDAAEQALHDLLERRTSDMAARQPGEVTETSLPVGGESVRLLERKSWPVRVAYGESRGVLVLGVRADAVRRVHETLQGNGRGAAQGARFRAVWGALGRAEPEEGRLPPEVLTLVFADLQRWSALIREISPDMARGAQDAVDRPALRRKVEQQNPRRPGEAPAAYGDRVGAIFDAEMRKVIDEARRQIELPLKLVDLFSAGGLEVSVAEGGYRLRGALLVK